MITICAWRRQGEEKGGKKALLPAENMENIWPHPVIENFKHIGHTVTHDDTFPVSDDKPEQKSQVPKVERLFSHLEKCVAVNSQIDLALLSALSID